MGTDLDGMGRLLEANRLVEPGFEPLRRPIRHDHGGASVDAGWRGLNLYDGVVWLGGTLRGGGLLSGRSR